MKKLFYLSLLFAVFLFACLPTKDATQATTITCPPSTMPNGVSKMIHEVNGASIAQISCDGQQKVFTLQGGATITFTNGPGNDVQAPVYKDGETSTFMDCSVVANGKSYATLQDALSAGVKTTDPGFAMSCTVGIGVIAGMKTE